MTDFLPALDPDVSPRSEAVAPPTGRVDQGLRIVVIGTESPSRDTALKACRSGGFTSVAHFQYAHDALPFLRRSRAGLVLVMAEVGDMHWSTLVRALRTDPTIPFTPAIFVDTLNDLRKKDNIELLKSYRVSSIALGSLTVGTFKQSITQAVLGDENLSALRGQVDQAKAQFQTAMTACARIVGNDLMAGGRQRKPKEENTESDGRKEFGQLMRLINADPENYNFRFGLLSFYLKNKRLDRFNALFDALTTDLRDATDGFWLCQLGQMCLTLKLPGFLARVIETLEVNRNGVDAWMPYYLRCRAHLEGKNVRLAASEIDLAIKACNHPSAELLNLKGIICRRRGDLRGSRDAYASGVAASPFDYRLLYNLAMAHVQLGERDDAKLALERALLINPSYDKAKELMGKLPAAVKN